MRQKKTAPQDLCGFADFNKNTVSKFKLEVTVTHVHMKTNRDSCVYTIWSFHDKYFRCDCYRHKISLLSSSWMVQQLH